MHRSLSPTQKKTKEVASIQARNVTFRFHNPNSPEVTADYLLSLLLHANQQKLDHAIEAEIAQIKEQEEAASV